MQGFMRGSRRKMWEMCKCEKCAGWIIFIHRYPYKYGCF
jgi:hypothetical protein